MNAEVVQNKSDIIKRLALFVFVTIPGAYLAVMGGVCMATGIIQRDEVGYRVLFFFVWLLGGILLLLGTRTTARPLYVTAVLPMPFLLALGCGFCNIGDDRGGFIIIAGIATPIILCPLVHWYYGARAARAERINNQTQTTLTDPVSVVTQ